MHRLRLRRQRSVEEGQSDGEVMQIKQKKTNALLTNGRAFLICCYKAKVVETVRINVKRRKQTSCRRHDKSCLIKDFQSDIMGIRESRRCTSEQDVSGESPVFLDSK